MRPEPPHVPAPAGRHYRLRSTPATPAAVPVRPPLGIGHQGPSVRDLQIALTRAGEQVNLDGIFGSRTWDALRSFQIACGLNPDGIAGPLTTAALT